MLIAIEVRDYKRIDKLMALTNIDTFWEDVKKLTRNITSDHSLGRWLILAEKRYKELRGE